VFAGFSTPLAIRSFIDVYLDGPIYNIVGQGRISGAANVSINSPGSVLASALEAGGLAAAFFPTSLNLAGLKATGGGKRTSRAVSGNTTFLQGDAGGIIIKTGAGTATWAVPDLAEVIDIEMHNVGSAAVTLNPTGSKDVVGSLNLPAGALALARFINDDIHFIGTSDPE
jgi:hypothetical protein